MSDSLKFEIKPAPADRVPTCSFVTLHGGDLVGCGREAVVAYYAFFDDTTRYHLTVHGFAFGPVAWACKLHVPNMEAELARDLIEAIERGDTDEELDADGVGPADPQDGDAELDGTAAEE